MTFPSVQLDLGDSAELAQLLLFVRDWLGHDPALAESLTRFVGSDTYPLSDLRADLAKFVFLLGADVDEIAFQPNDQR
jgi:hypothetical protein